MSSINGPDRPQGSRHIIDSKYENRSKRPVRTHVSSLVDEVEAQANRLISLAGEFQAEKSILEGRIAAFQTRRGQEIVSRSDLDNFQLVEIASNTHVYIVKGHPETSDWICPDCLADCVAVALRAENAEGGARPNHVCPRCNFLAKSDHPGSP